MGSREGVAHARAPLSDAWRTPSPLAHLKTARRVAARTVSVLDRAAPTSKLTVRDSQP